MSPLATRLMIGCTLSLGLHTGGLFVLTQLSSSNASEGPEVVVFELMQLEDHEVREDSPSDAIVSQDTAPPAPVPPKAEPEPTPPPPAAATETPAEVPPEALPEPTPCATPPKAPPGAPPTAEPEPKPAVEPFVEPVPPATEPQPAAELEPVPPAIEPEPIPHGMTPAAAPEPTPPDKARPALDEIAPREPVAITGDEPWILHREAVVYPARALRRGIEGMVQLRLQLGPTGSVESVEVLTSSGSASLDEAARAALGAWRFDPKRAPSRVLDQTVRFSKQGG